MTTEDLKNKTFIGIVEENKDPKKIGRIKARVASIYDEIPMDDMPWCKPYKDLNGNQFTVPDIGKIVLVIFDEGSIYKPEYISSEHYNINLEKKLESLSDDTYVSMRALVFDNKTQIYSNDDEGIKLDYKFNNINLTETNIDLNLKDDYGKISIGDANADQQSILGTNFMNWMDKFLDTLMSGPYLGNMGAPVVSKPDLIKIINEYKRLRDPKFLSNNVYIASNYKIKSVRDNKSRINIDQIGDGVNARSTGSSDFSPGYDPNNDANSSMDDTFNPNVSTKITNAEVLKSVGEVTNEFKASQIGDFAKRLVAISRSQLGVVEIPKDSNTGPDVRKYQGATWLKGSGFAWCAAFVCWCFGEASNGISYNFKLPKTAGAWDFENWARSQGQAGVQIIKPPFNEIKPGDVIIFKFSHIGIATSTLSGGKVAVIEGNTSASDSDPISKQREGGGVFKKMRSTSLIKTVLRIP